MLVPYIEFFFDPVVLCFVFRDCSGHTPLHFAAACGHVGILNGLLQVVGNGVHMDNHGYTPLHWACFNGMYQPDTTYEDSLRKLIA